MDILKEGPANLQKNIETVGGKLLLTQEKLIFTAHNFNIQGGVTEINVSEIKGIEKCWTKFLGFIPLLPNSFLVATAEGGFRFVVTGRNAWMAAINGAKNI